MGQLQKVSERFRAAPKRFQALRRKDAGVPDGNPPTGTRRRHLAAPTASMQGVSSMTRTAARVASVILAALLFAPIAYATLYQAARILA